MKSLLLLEFCERDQINHVQHNSLQLLFVLSSFGYLKL
jgi:hypothetical protein